MNTPKKEMKSINKEDKSQILFEDSKDEIVETPLDGSTPKSRFARTGFENEGRPAPVIAGYLQLIPTFSGDQESDQNTLRDVTDRISCIAPSASWTKEVCLLVLKSRLKGHAAAFIESTNALRFSRDYDFVVRALEKQFRETEHDYFRLNRITSCKQMANENVRDYATRFRTLCRGLFADEEGEGSQMSEMKDNMLRSCFINGLTLRIKRQVLSRVPTSFQQAVDLGIQEESFDNMTSRTSQVHLIEKEDEREPSMTRLWKDMLGQREAILKKITELTGEIREESKIRFEKLEKRIDQLYQDRGNYSSQTGATRVPQRNGRINRQQIRCYDCGQMGHYRYECQVPRQPYQNPSWATNSQRGNVEQGLFTQPKASFLGVENPTLSQNPDQAASQKGPYPTASAGAPRSQN